jgi:hypothetical protein
MKSIAKHPQEAPALVTERERVEYDRFGPWTYSVTSPAEMPPRFDPWYEELRDSALILKLPLPMERRSMKPGDDLYESLISVGVGSVVYLHLTKGEVRRRELVFGEIAALRLSQELLYGQLSLDLVDGSSVTIVFNTVSAELFDDFAAAVRGGCGAAVRDSRFGAAASPPSPSKDDHLFQNLLRSLQTRDPKLSILAYQEPCLLRPEEDRRRESLVEFAARFLRWRLDGCLLASTGSELVALVRGSGKPRISRSRGYRYEKIYIQAEPYHAASVEERRLANGAAFFALRLSSAGQDYELLFDRDPSGALAAL